MTCEKWEYLNKATRLTLSKEVPSIPCPPTLCPYFKSVQLFNDYGATALDLLHNWVKERQFTAWDVLNTTAKPNLLFTNTTELKQILVLSLMLWLNKESLLLLK